MPEGNDVIQLAGIGDHAAFAAIVRQHGERLYRSAFLLSANAEDARDIVQETFLQAYSGLHSFQGRSDLYTWLYRIMVRRLSRVRRRRPANAPVDIDAESPVDPALGPAEAVERRSTLASTHAAVAELPVALRTAVVMKYYEGFSSVQIAEALGISPSRARARLADARQRLRAKLSAHLSGAHEPSSTHVPKSRGVEP